MFLLDTITLSADVISNIVYPFPSSFKYFEMLILGGDFTEKQSFFSSSRFPYTVTIMFISESNNLDLVCLEFRWLVFIDIEHQYNVQIFNG